jgi:hypothetical protein
LVDSFSSHFTAARATSFAELARPSWSLVMLANRALAAELQRELQKAVRGA